MIPAIIFTIFMTMAYQAGDEDRTADSLDEKVRETTVEDVKKKHPYIDRDRR